MELDSAYDEMALVVASEFSNYRAPLVTLTPLVIVLGYLISRMTKIL